MNWHDSKIYLLNGFALSVSMTNIETYLRITLLVLSIAYTIFKLLKNDKDEKL
jgi:sRNA-binding regulator protein Hfq